MLTYNLPHIDVSEIMARKVATVNVENTIEQLIKKFKKYDFHSFPVLDESNLVGMVTKTDLLKVIDEGDIYNLTATHVKDIMTPNPTTITSNEQLIKAAYSMKKHKIRILPVVDGEKLTGLLSYSDLIKTIFKI